MSPTVVRVQYQGAAAYLVMSSCCDRFNYLYNRNAEVLCAPSGGLDGKGDGQCKGPIR